MESDARDSPWNFHRCDVCRRYRTASIRSMLLHVRRYRPQRAQQCFNCFSDCSQWYQCDQCEFRTDLKVVLLNHEKHVHEGQSGHKHTYNCYVCDSCYFETHSVLVLGSHVCSRSRDEVYKWFERELSSKLEKLNRVETHVINKQVTSQYDQHENFKCKERSYQTKNKTCLTVPILGQPHNIDWVQCPHCPYKSKDNLGIRSHIKSAHEDPEKKKLFKCEQCPYQNKFKSQLSQHVHFNHTQIKYKCERKANLTEHIKCKHTTPEHMNWFKCACRNRNLQQHMTFQLQKSKNIDRLQCPHCPYKCTIKNDLKVHIIARHSEKINWFKCKQCSYKAQFKSILKSHITRKHTS